MNMIQIVILLLSITLPQGGSAQPGREPSEQFSGAVETQLVDTKTSEPKMNSTETMRKGTAPSPLHTQRPSQGEGDLSHHPPSGSVGAAGEGAE